MTNGLNETAHEEGRATKHILTLKYYYLITPIFIVLDVFYDISLRVSIPGDHKIIEYIYYAICFVASFIVFKNETTAAAFSLVECSINILLLVSSVLLPIYTLPASMNDDPIIPFEFGVFDVFHFILAGGVLLYCFHTNPIILRSKKFY